MSAIIPEPLYEYGMVSRFLFLFYLRIHWPGTGQKSFFRVVPGEPPFRLAAAS
jgi:hypothetical protein